MGLETFVKATAFDEKNEIVVPCVVLNQSNEFWGFVPGLKQEYIKDFLQENCMQKTIDNAHETLKNMLKEKQAIPFFPTEEEIKQSYENVCAIKFFKIKKL